MSEEISRNEERCGNCGEVIPGDAPEGVCPQCVLLRATAPASDEAGSGGGPAGDIGPEEVQGLLPNLEVERELGRGGMGVVFKGRQTGLGREVAVKLLRSGSDGDPERDERFLREARALAKLEHAGVTAVYDFGRAGEFWYLVTEYVEGESLADRLARGAMAEAEALAVWGKVAEAIRYAHGRGVVHRDVKPANVLLGPGNTVKVADFGLAKMLGDGGDGMFTLTLEAQAVGTPYYMAPEQRSGGGEIDERADVYALGVLLFEMLTGGVPEVSAERPAALGRFEAVAMKAMRAQAGERYASVDEMAGAVQAAAAGSGGEVAAKKPWGLGKVFRARWVAFVLGLVLAPVLGVVIALVAAYSLPRLYEARVMMQVTGEPTDSTYVRMRTQLEILRGRLLLERLVQEQELEERWMVSKGEALDILRHSVGPEIVRSTDLIEVKVRRPDPEEAAMLANAVFEVYADLIRGQNEGPEAADGGTRVLLHERAEVPSRAASPTFRGLFLVSIGGGVLLALPFALVFMYLVHAALPWRRSNGSA